MTEQYDYIICGAGAAGMSLAFRLCDPAFDHLKILLIDKEEKRGNDHTWCFWDKEKSPYDEIASNKFSRINFFSSALEKTMDMAPYSYKMIQSDPFYKMIRNKINESSHIEFVTEEVSDITETSDGVTVKTGKNDYNCKEVFSSIFNGEIDKEKHLYVAQHFRGWFIKTSQRTFDKNTATFMDFRIDQAGDCRFFYVLPTSSTEALVEIAIFSNEVMKPEAYDPLIKDYIKTYMKDISYEIEETEYGVIPMTDYPFWKHNTSRIHHIGTAGGAVKPSSGFAFKRIQEHTNRIIQTILNGEPLSKSYDVFKNRFYLYDSILLDVILKQKKSGADIFTYMFKSNPPQNIFRFLDGHTSLTEEMKIFKTFPTYPFTRGWFRQKLGI